MNPNNIPKGAGQLELPEDGRAINPPGVYEHKASGAKIIAMPDARSTAHQDALVRMGFVKVADAPTRLELAEMQKKQLASDQEKEKKGIMPGITADPNAPRFNPTASINVEDAPRLVAEAEQRAAAAEAELAALKAQQSQSSESESTSEDASEGSEESSTGSESESTSEDAGETQTNENEGK